MGKSIICRSSILIGICLSIVFGANGQNPSIVEQWQELSKSAYDAYYHQRLDKALVLSKTMLKFAKKSGNDSLLMRAYRFIGTIEPDPAAAIKAYQQTLEIAERKKHLTEQIEVLSNMSLFLQQLGKIPDAYRNAKRLFAIAQNTNDVIARQQSGLVLSSLYLMTGETSKSIEQMKQSANAYQETVQKKTAKEVDKLRLAELWVGISMGYRLLHRLDSARYFGQLGLDYARQTQLSLVLLRAYLNKADLYSELAEATPTNIQEIRTSLDSASHYLDQNIPGMGDLYGQSRAKYLLYSGQYQACIQLCDTLLHAAEEVHNALTQKLMYELLYQCHQKSGRFEQALKYHQAFSQYSDTLRQQELNYHLGVYEVDREVNEKEVENLKLKQQVQAGSRRNLAILAFIFILGLFGYLFFSNRLLKEKNKVLSLKDEANKKAEELRAFNYSLGHDLKAPIENARMFLERFEQKFNWLDREAKEYFVKLKLILEDTRNMINGMLVYAENDQLPMLESEIETRLEVEKLVDSIKFVEFERKIDFELGELPVIRGDKFMMRQVLTNLIGNAVKFTRTRKLASIQVYSKLRDGYWEIMVKDNGTGIPENGLSSIFKLFKTAHDRGEYPGTGIGLSIVKRIVERHKGSVWAYNNPEGGATFGFSIPDQR